jgi:hypothetical protein
VDTSCKATTWKIVVILKWCQRKPVGSVTWTKMTQAHVQQRDFWIRSVHPSGSLTSRSVMMISDERKYDLKGIYLGKLNVQPQTSEQLNSVRISQIEIWWNLNGLAYNKRCSLCRLIRLLSTWCRAAAFFSASGATLSQEVPTVKWMSNQSALWTPDITNVFLHAWVKTTTHYTHQNETVGRD